VAALANWLWGAISTVGILRALRTARTIDVRDGAWVALGVAVTVLWTAVAGISIFAPVLETGSDPTRIPLAALLSPIVATLFTRYLAEFLVEVPVGRAEREAPEKRPEPAKDMPPEQEREAEPRDEPEETPGESLPRG
jgi:hypothetical protein